MKGSKHSLLPAMSVDAMIASTGMVAVSALRLFQSVEMEWKCSVSFFAVVLKGLWPLCEADNRCQSCKLVGWVHPSEGRDDRALELSDAVGCRV